MKKSALLIGLIALSLQTAQAAPQCGSAQGNMIAGKVTMSCLNISGSAKMDGTTIKDTLTMTGPLDAKNTRLGSLIVTGDVKIADSVISGPTTIVGTLDSSNTTYEGKVQITSNTVTLTHSTVSSITINAAKPGKKIYLYLKDNSFINGDIVFTGGAGVVKSKQSTISGKVVGGTVE